MKIVHPIAISAFFLLSFSLHAQRGVHGPRTINAANTIVNEYTALTANATTGNTSITVAASTLNANGRFTGNLAPGDLVMIIQVQGASMIGTLNGIFASPIDTSWGRITSYNNCGWYEFAQVRTVPNATTITLDCGLSHDYSTGGNNRTQVIRVPRYTTLTINNGGVLTCDAWNGSIGGIVAVEVLNNTVINAGGSINATGRGFRGGSLVGDNLSTVGVNNVGSTDANYGAERGEGVVAYSAAYDPMGGRYGKGAAGNSGGGGDAHNAGGGGGANAGNLSLWKGLGIPDLTGVNWNTAWSLEPPANTINNLNATNSSGGGKGGYSFSSSNQNAITLPPGNINWGGDKRNHEACGLGGRPLDYSTGRLFLGGGGGAGDQNDNYGGPGGNGGGLIYLMSYGTISGAGSVISNGNNGTNSSGTPPINGYSGNDGGGGGGAGGTIVLNSVGAISGISCTANGGEGGDQAMTRGAFFFGNINEAEGPGGGGGGGYIGISNGTITRTTNGGINGTTNSDALNEFTPNGATNGCPGINNGTITNFTISASNVTICAGNSATLTAVLSGTVPPGTTIIWYDAAVNGNVLGTGATYTTPVLSATTTYYVGTCPGTYTIPVTVTVTPGLTISISPSSSTICTNGNVTLTASGGTTYSWAPASGLSNTTIANPVASPTVTTTYTVYGTTGSCTGNSTVTVTVNPPVNASVNPASAGFCAGGNVQLTASGGTGYAWSPASGLSSTTVSNPVANPTSTTTYTVVVTDASGCTGTTTVTVTVNPAATATLAPASASVCSGSSVQLAAGGGTSYSWAPSSGLSSASVSNPTASPATTTIYTVVVTNASGCTDTATVTVTVNPAATASVTPASATICSSGTVTLSATGGTSYSWSPASGLSSATSSSPVASPSVTTTYTVFVTNASGCTDTAAVTVTVQSSITASAGSGVSICLNDSVTLNASGGTTYAWSPATGLSNTTSSNPVASPTLTTTYTVTVSSGTCSDTASVTVTVNPVPAASVTPASASICSSGSVNLTALGGSSYSWSPSTGLSSTTISNPVASPTVTTTYFVFVTDSNGCFDSASVTVTVTPSVVANAGSSATICANDSVLLNASGGSTYSWSPPNGLSNPAVPNPSASPSVTTTYTVTVSSGMCSDTASVTVVVNPLPAASAGNNVTICNGNDTTLTASGGINYVWSPSASLSASTGSSVIASPTVTTTYTVIVTDGNGCSATAQVTVTVNNCVAPTPVISSSGTSVCAGNCITFTDASTGSPTAWTWTFQDGTPASSTQQNPGPVCFAAAGTDTVTLTVTNAFGTTTTSMVVTVSPVPVATAGTSTAINSGSNVTLSAGGGGTYSWAPSTGLSCTTCANPVASPTVSTTYTVFVSQNGCTDTAQVRIDVVDQKDVYIPSAFSPNGDGQNDFLFVRGVGIKGIHLVIFDRIGEKIFETTDITIGWDGTYKGQPMNSGVFVYYADVYFVDDTTTRLKGDVSLIR